MHTSFLHTQLLLRQRVFVRADLNVPIAENGTIKNDKRLKSMLPTIKHIQKRGGKVIIGSHIGQPSGGNLEHHLSTRNLVSWFEQEGFVVDFESDMLAAQPKTYENQERIMLLENLRFFVGEREYSMPFADLLANLADLYVNDAFGTMHRNDTSVSLLPRLFLPQNRGWGLLVEEELSHLEPLHVAPQQPLMLVLGGAKAADKIPLMTNFLLHHAPQAILLGGKLAFPFLAAQGKNLGASQPSTEEITLAKQVLDNLRSTKLILPIDFVVTNDVITDIGAQSIDLFANHLTNAKTIFLNGTMGINDTPADSQGTAGIINAIAQLHDCTKIVGGGDAVAAVETLGKANAMTFLSTGGGATLAYLASENPWQELPGLKALGPAA